jgi:hypothetical protein
MRILAVRSLAALALLLPLGSCSRGPKSVPAPTVEESPEVASVVHTADPKTAAQLLRGFYDVEQNAWRWSARKFAVVLRPPANAAAAGALLELKFAIPDVVVQKLKSFSLSASVNGVPLAPAKFDSAGEKTYSQDVPSKALKGDAVIVEFELDKAVEAGVLDQRELGVVVSYIGFEAK